MDSVNGARIAINAQVNVPTVRPAPLGAASASGANSALRLAPNPAGPAGLSVASGAPGPAAADSAELSAAASAMAELPEDFKGSPDLMAAYKAAEEARAAMLAEGRVPTMSSIDAARIIALLS